MKCQYLEKICTKPRMTCQTCMAEEINYLRKKVADLESRNNAKAGSIMITKDELIDAQAKALTRLSLMKPALFMIHNELEMAAAMTVHMLFDEEED